MNPGRVDSLVDLAYGVMIFISIALIVLVGDDVGLAFGFGVLVSYAIHVVWKMARFDPYWMGGGEAIEETVKDTVGQTVEATVDAAVGETVDQKVEETVEETVGEAVEETVGKQVEETVEETMKDTVDETVEETVRETVEETVEGAGDGGVTTTTPDSDDEAGSQEDPDDRTGKSGDTDDTEEGSE